MTREEAIITLTNTAFLLRDGTRYMKLEHEKQFREAYEMAIKALEQPEPEIYWGYTPTLGRPLADLEIISRLRTIQKQIGGSYAIDRAIEIIEAVEERRTENNE